MATAQPREDHPCNGTYELCSWRQDCGLLGRCARNAEGGVRQETLFGSSAVRERWRIVRPPVSVRGCCVKPPCATWAEDQGGRQSGKRRGAAPRGRPWGVPVQYSGRCGTGVRLHLAQSHGAARSRPRARRSQAVRSQISVRYGTDPGTLPGGVTAMWWLSTSGSERPGRSASVLTGRQLPPPRECAPAPTEEGRAALCGLVRPRP